MAKQGKVYRRSKTSVVAATRLPPEVNAILERRARYHPYGKAGYMRDRLIYDLTRKHTKHNNHKREELGLGQHFVANDENVGSIPTSRSTGQENDDV